ncbi:transposase%2C IS204/IS1001/IS1096/IS1165 [Streptococcus suis]|uniref:Transposase, IS204/IS1001/IS1096/IS1165 n=1 Tax=Streptococcus suis TaxID=1307 RepID=A0A0Z8LD03_STRSU|nr:transposase%2C IS204/IS1001/IS1096/IS1165 [Streptococcus suis]
MEQLNLITNFLRIKDKNKYDMGTHLELHGHLDYTAPKCPSCKGQMAKYDFQKASKIPYIETADYPLLIRLRKRRFKCKNCGKMAVAETPLVKKKHQISVAVNQKITQLLIENQAMQHIAHRLSISTSSVIRKLNEFKFETDWNTLPEGMSWESNSLGIDCLSCLQEGEDELYRSRFQLPKRHCHPQRKNSSNHPKPLSTLS